MPIEGIVCDKCGSSDVMEYKPNTYLCKACDHTFKYVDPSRTAVEVSPQFCEEGCGNPIKYKCSLCGKMVCEAHGEKAKELLSRRAQQNLTGSIVPELQAAWCVECFEGMSEEDKARYIALILKDNDRTVRRAAVVAVYNMGNPKHDGVSANTTPYLCEALKDGDEFVRLGAVRALADIGDPSIVPCLGEALKDDDSLVRHEAANALGKIGDSSAVPELCEALKDNSSSVQSSAAEALGNIGNASAVPALRQALKDDEYYVRHASAVALGKIGDFSAVPELCEALKDNSSGVQSSAAEALGNIGNASAVPALRQALKDDSSEVRESAAAALEDIGRVTKTEDVSDVRKQLRHHETVISYQEMNLYKQRHKAFFIDFILGFAVAAGILGIRFFAFREDRTCLTYGIILLSQFGVLTIVILAMKNWIWLVLWVIGIIYFLWFLIFSENTDNWVMRR